MGPKGQALAEGIEALAIGIAWLALTMLLSFGGVWIVSALGVRPYDVDQPVLGPDEILASIVESLIVTLGCTAVAGVCMVVRRFTSANGPQPDAEAGIGRQPPPGDDL